MKFLKTLPYITFGVLMTAFAFDGIGQEIERYALPSAGEVFTNENYSLQFTLGEPYANTVYGGGQLTQGFEQEWAVVTAIDEPGVVALDVNLFPNLTQGILNIEAEESVEASVFDIYGQMLKSWHIEAGRISVQIDELPSGMYMVVFKSSVGNKIRSFKVNKIQ